MEFVDLRESLRVGRDPRQSGIDRARKSRGYFNATISVPVERFVEVAASFRKEVNGQHPTVSLLRAAVHPLGSPPRVRSAQLQNRTLLIAS